MQIPRVPAWQYTLTGGVLAVLTARALDSTAFWLLLQTAGVMVLWRTANRHRCSWWLALAAVTAGLAVTAGWALYDGEPTNTPMGLSLAVPYSLLAAAAFQFGRRRRAGSAAEAGAVVLGLAMLAWSFIVLPYLGDPGYQQVDRSLALLYAVIDIALVGTALRNLTDPRRGPARLLAAAALTLVGAHLVYAATGSVGTGPFQPGGLCHLCVQLAWVFVVAAAVHPAAGQYRAGTARTGRAALIGMYTAAVAAPLLPALANPSVVVVVPALLTSGLSGLLLLRIVGLARLAGARAKQARESLREQQKLQEQLTYRAGHDALTGLANRDLLTERLNRAVAGDRPYALILCALDGFKDINDTYGHPVGDAVLRQVAGRLLLFAPQVDMVARIGGDEFGFLLGPETDSGQLAQQVVEAVGSAPFLVDDRRIPLTARAGVAGGVPGNDAVLSDADLALSAAKESGGGIARFDDSLRAEQTERARIAAGLRQAISDGSLFMHYQPVVDTASGRITGVEALMRWRQDGELIPPGEFIPVAEQTGLIGTIGARALRLACAQAAVWHRDHGLYLTVNVSTHQLRDPGFADSVLRILADTGLPAAALVLEITESVLIDASDTNVLGILRAYGIRIAIDDFGTGYSSLAYLHTLPVDILKIDQSFIRRHQDPPRPQDVSLTRAILELARSQDLLAVAEGVETAAQANLLRELDCPLVQGYHFGRPSAPEVIDVLLREAAVRTAA
ncbi:diguanylate cyclase (GGDEF)-like protein [Actinoplanes couchii]|uniref:putative bifunctional diguanylate cyclase/phosphodiesterase n=2 Tax=Actinoplanes couchii TaxID=403638 RepID=UPI00194160B8|nr:bifunctional diguanylate cyclase/phosphodiesterase [Actinoplanes couchii]MDR6316694.1 diguanylate cyclase (GGDEF)-like protein [Actinoplanes couchii]